MNFTFPSHLILSINHNDHKSCYEKIEDYLNDESMKRRKHLSQEEYDQCIESDEIWEIQWYPITPISFCYVCAPTLEKCFFKIQNSEWN